jgi:mannitol/fructose-specific phosphotransferase system IIA component (Ntr-type)
MAIPLTSSDKTRVLEELVSLLPSARDDATRRALLEAVVERENRMSTGIGQGIAIPHGKSDLIPTMEISFGLAPAGVAYEALDGEPVRILFLLVSSPGQTGPHIQALAQISRLLSSDVLRERLASATEPADVLDILRMEEAVQEESES